MEDRKEISPACRYLSHQGEVSPSKERNYVSPRSAPVELAPGAKTLYVVVHADVDVTRGERVRKRLQSRSTNHFTFVEVGQACCT